MIEDLRNGQSLRSEIPIQLRGKVTEVRLRFAPSDRSAYRANGAAATTPPTLNQRANTAILPNPGQADPYGFRSSSQGIGDRTDSNTLQNNIPRFNLPPVRSTFGNQNSSNTSGMNRPSIPGCPAISGAGGCAVHIAVGSSKSIRHTEFNPNATAAL